MGRRGKKGCYINCRVDQNRGKEEWRNNKKGQRKNRENTFDPKHTRIEKIKKDSIV